MNKPLRAFAVFALTALAAAQARNLDLPTAIPFPAVSSPHRKPVLRPRAT